MCKFRDFEKYEVYSDGRIWSYLTNKFLKPSTDKQGYQIVSLSDNEGKVKKYLVHRVIYESVTGEPIPKGMQCNHINECKSDNRFCNINLLTPKQNINWGTCIERSAKAHSKVLTNNKKISKAVGAFKDEKLVMTFPSTQEAGRQGFGQGAVAACCRNCYSREGNNFYKGYTWKYL